MVNKSYTVRYFEICPFCFSKLSDGRMQLRESRLACIPTVGVSSWHGMKLDRK